MIKRKRRRKKKMTRKRKRKLASWCCRETWWAFYHAVLQVETQAYPESVREKGGVKERGEKERGEKERKGEGPEGKHNFRVQLFQSVNMIMVSSGINQE